MSSILKALRRLEEERARQSSIAPEIAASLLRRGPRRRKSYAWIWTTAITAVVVGGLLWSWRTTPTSQTITPLMSSAAIVSAATVQRAGEVIIEEVIEQRRPVLLPPPKVVAKPAPLSARISPPPLRVDPGVSSPAQVKKSAAVSVEERQQPVISAIAWQDDSAARMAVVDGLPVMTGEFVGTAKVQEILRDRILFAEAGRLFTVYIDPH